MKLNEAFRGLLGLRGSPSRRQQELDSHGGLRRDMMELRMCSPRVFMAIQDELRGLGVSADSQPELHAQVYRLLGAAIRDGHAARLKHLEFMCGVADILDAAMHSVRTHFKVQGDAYGTEWTDRVTSEIHDLSLFRDQVHPHTAPSIVAPPSSTVSVL